MKVDIFGHLKAVLQCLTVMSMFSGVSAARGGWQCKCDMHLHLESSNEQGIAGFA